MNVYGTAEVRWKRVYADGQVSDERCAEGPTVEACLRAVIDHEAEADRMEPEHAGPPPVAREPLIVKAPTLLARVKGEVMNPTPTQEATLRRMADSDGMIHYEKGGFWTTNDVPLRPDGVPSWYVAIQTVRAMERAGWVEPMGPKQIDPRRLTEEGRRRAREG